MAKSKYTFEFDQFLKLQEPGHPWLTPNNDRLEADIRYCEQKGYGRIMVALSHMNWDFSAEVVDIWFQGNLSTSDQEVLIRVVENHTGEPITPVQKVKLDEKKGHSGALLVEPAPVIGEGFEIASHNLCDPTTWYTSAVQVLDHTLVDQGDAKTFRSANADYQANWIDASHGKILRENLIRAQYAPHITVNGVTQTENSMFVQDGDYSIDYATGTVTFNEEQVGQTVWADFWHATTSEWILAPQPGTVLVIKDSETQFSEDLLWNDAIVYDVSFGGQVVRTSEYRSIMQMMMEARGAHPAVPSVGGPGGIPSPMHGFPFIYAAATPLPSSMLAQIKVRLAHDIPFGGSHSSITFYGNVVSEEEWAG